MHNREMFSPAHRKRAGSSGDALATSAGYASERNRDIRRDKHLTASKLHVPVSVKAFSVFAHDSKIKVSGPFRHALVSPGWTDVCEKIEVLPEEHRRIDRIWIIERCHGSQNQTIRGPYNLKGFGAYRRA